MKYFSNNNGCLFIDRSTATGLDVSAYPDLLATGSRCLPTSYHIVSRLHLPLCPHHQDIL